jgi:OmpR-family two-component system manganese-sensing sensor histidine kinase
MLPSQHQALSIDALLLAVVEEQRLRAQQVGISLCLEIGDFPAPFLGEQGDGLRVWGDWDELARLFTNLIGNALDYAYGEEPSAFAGAKVLIRLQPTKRDRVSFFQIDVQDWGVGIPSDALPHLFDRFYRVDSARSHRAVREGGSGLGLAIAQSIVGRHQGYLSVESSSEQGTCFSVMLPLLEPD